MISLNKTVLVTGGFDPLHKGHISYFKAAKKLGDRLIVGLNSDDWLTRKKGRFFMPIDDRASIIDSLDVVDGVILFDDTDDTAIRAIQNVKMLFPEDHIIFANGGDRTQENIPEMVFNDVDFCFGVGGYDKKNSSSWILADYHDKIQQKTQRNWGYYRVLHESGKEVKVKELTVDPGQRLSMQQHDKRSEHWFVDTGVATVYTLNVSTDYELLGVFNKHETLHIPAGKWHQLCNETDQPLKLVEIQYGEECVEEDIRRFG
jgi:cytidyltransferase-like protein